MSEMSPFQRFVCCSTEHTPTSDSRSIGRKQAPFFFCDPSRRPFRPLSSPPATKILPLSDRPSEPTRRPSPLAYHPSSGGRRALLDPTTPPASPSPPDPSPSRNPGGPLHPPSALALWDPVEPSRRRSDGDPSSPVGWRALRSEGWKWEGSRTDPSRSGRVEGWRVEGWRGG